MEKLTRCLRRQYLSLLCMFAPLSPAYCWQPPSDSCTLLKTADYQTPFCQNQYQQVLKFTAHVFNPQNQNVLRGQSLGGVIGIYQRSNDQEQICYVSCGLRHLNGRGPNEYTLFELASITKTFTASVLATLIHTQRLKPGDAVAPLLPRDFALTAKESAVTLQQLATFAGGVCFSNAPDVNLQSGNQILNQARFAMDVNQLDPSLNRCMGRPHARPKLKSVYATPLPTYNYYSNSSIGLLAQALMNYDAFPNTLEGSFNGWICKNITNVLAMQHTNACLPYQARSGRCPTNVAPNGGACDTRPWRNAEYSAGYHIKNNHYQQGKPFPFIPWAGAGALRSNASDMIKFIRANLGFSTSNDRQQLALIQGMQLAHTAGNYLPAPPGESAKPNFGNQAPLKGRQGYAWVCQMVQGNRICGKIGGHTNFRSFVGFSQSKHYGVIVLLNTGSGGNNGLVKIPTVSQIGVNLIKNAP